jgi:thiol-disulfide isomerase/thioredoxin
VKAIARDNSAGIFAIALILLVLSLSLISVRQSRRWLMEHPAVSDPELHFTGRDIFNNLRAASTRDGNVLLLQLWATWCATCQAEVPTLIELQRNYAARGFEIVGYSLDADPAIVRGFCRRSGINYAVFMLNSELEQFLARVLGVPWREVANRVPIPTAILFGRDGHIRGVYVGRDIGVIDMAVCRLMESENAAWQPEAIPVYPFLPIPGVSFCPQGEVVREHLSN